MLTCPLCLKLVAKFHKRSHLIPEWMYTDCYDEKHKILEISRSNEKAVKRQKGIYDSFMCERCEEKTQRYDHYASLILTERSTNSDEYKTVKRKRFYGNDKGEQIEFCLWEDIDFRKFQKFVFSIVLRTYFAEKIKGTIPLNKKHLDGILAIYEDELNLDDSSYPVLITKYYKNDKLKNHIVLPYISKQNGHHIIEFAGGGYLFNIYVSSHSKPRFVQSLRLKSNGSTYLIRMFFHETGLYRSTKALISTLKNVSRYI